MKLYTALMLGDLVRSSWWTDDPHKVYAQFLKQQPRMSQRRACRFLYKAHRLLFYSTDQWRQEYSDSQDNRAPLLNQIT